MSDHTITTTGRFLRVRRPVPADKNAAMWTEVWIQWDSISTIQLHYPDTPKIRIRLTADANRPQQEDAIDVAGEDALELLRFLRKQK